MPSVTLTDVPVAVPDGSVPPGKRTFLSQSAILGGLITSAAPLLLLLANTDWFFTREGFLDPWNYIGLFHQYLDPDYLPEDYKLARLPWILSGFMAMKLLPPVPAAVALHGVFMCVTSLALFVGICALFRRPALAGVVALSFGFFTLAHGSGGWDYHNTGAGAFYFATFALLALPATLDGSRTLLVTAGGTAALAIHTNITLVNFLPALASVHICALSLRTEQRPGAGSLGTRSAWIAAGALLVTVLLGLINWSVGREFLFFKVLLRLVLQFLADPSLQQAFHAPWSSGWLLGAWHLSFMAAVFLAGATSLAVDRLAAADSSRRLANALVMQFLAMSLVWIAWQSAGQTALDLLHFAYVLIPSCFVALSGILFRGWPEWCERHWLVTLLSTTLLLTLCLTVAQLPGVSTLLPFIAPFIFPGGCVLFFAALAMHVWRPSLASVLLFIVTFAFGNRLLSVPLDYLASDPCKVQPAVYGAIVDGATWLMKVDPLYTRLYTWFDDKELLYPKEGCTVRLGHLGNSMTAMASVGYVAKAFPLPSVDELPDASVLGLAEGGRILAIISRQPAHLEEWKRRFEGVGLVGEEIDRHDVRVMGAELTMYAWTVHPRSP
jgi:hypothetical protein